MKITNREPWNNFFTAGFLCNNRCNLLRRHIFIIANFICLSCSLFAQDPVSVSATVGIAATYSNLKNAFDAINNGTHQGQVQITLTGNTTETATAILNASGTGGSSFSSVSISPSGGAMRTISGSVASSLVDLNGADNVTWDGLNTGGNSLTIENTSTAANTATIRFLQDAGFNTMQNCTIKGSATGTNSGTVFFSTGLSTGNSNNTIASNSIGAAGINLPSTAIYSAGTTAYANANINITNNNIFNYTSNGINISSTGSDNWNISGNSFYKEENVLNDISGISSLFGIRISGGTGYTISNNFIGGEGSALSGSNAVYNSTGVFAFTGIFLTSSAATPASVIKGNIISKISVTISGTPPVPPYSSAFFTFYGIETAGSGIAVGGSTAGDGNTIGSASANGSLSFSTATNTTANSSSVYGIYFHSSGGHITGNQVAGLDINNVGSSPASSEFRAIYVSVSSPPLQVNNNIVGSLTTSNSIRVMATSTAVSTNITGFYLGSTISSALPQVNGNTIQNISHLSAVSSATFTGINAQNGYVQSYQDNTIRNIYAAPNNSTSSKVYTGILSSTSLSPSTIIANNIIDNIDYRSSGSAAIIRGMDISGSSPKVSTVQSNVISNLSTLSQKVALVETGDPNTFTIVGLLFITGGNGSVISNNNFYNFSSLSTANVNTVVAAIAINSPGSGSIYSNRISNLNNSSTGSASLPAIVGVKAFKGAYTMYNNSIKISNGSFANAVNIYGVLQNTAGSAWNYFHNSILISGNAGANTGRSAAFMRSSEGGLLLKNNVFINTRNSAGANYAVGNSVASPATSWLATSSDFNNLYSTNANTLAEWGTGTSNTMAQLQVNSGGENNSISRSVSFIESDYDLQPSNNTNCGLNDAGSPITTPVAVNIDLNTIGRSAANPDLGAYEFDYILPTPAATNDGAKCVGENISLGTITGVLATPLTYSWTGPSSFEATTAGPVLNNITPAMAGSYSVIVTDVNGCSGTAQTSVAVNSLPAGTINIDVGNIISLGTPVVFTATDGTNYNYKVNGNSVQNSSSPTYNSSNLATGNIVNVSVTNANGCTSTYAGITMSVSSIMVNGKTYLKWNGARVKKWNGIKKD